MDSSFVSSKLISGYYVAHNNRKLSCFQREIGNKIKKIVILSLSAKKSFP